jgi:radical SAM superfamily enzyme YgiQ (UPF0313 family)
VDVAVIGQGEHTFRELIHAARERRALQDIKGIVYRDGSRIMQSGPRPFEDVNTFPPMPYEILNLERNIRPSELGSRTIRYISSQGCPHRCGFCVDPVVYPKRWSGLKAERAVNEIAWLVEHHNVNAVIFTDSNFFTDLRRAVDIASLILERGLAINWGNANGRTRQLLRLTDTEWQLLKASGLREVLVGAESGLQAGLDLINKDTLVEETVTLSRICNRHGIKVRYSMMVGLPYDVRNGTDLKELIRSEFEAALRMLDAIYRQGTRQNRCLLFIYTPYPGTPLYHASLKLGFKEPKTLEEWANFELNMRNTPWVPRSIVKKVAMLTEYIFPWIEGDYMAQLRITRSVLRWPLLLAAWVLRTLANMRWRLKLFNVPIDYRAFKFTMTWIKWRP